MRRFAYIAALALLAGCGGAATETPQFEGRWRQYESSVKIFVEFKDGRITMGHESNAKSGSFSYQLTDDSEPLYRVQAIFPDGESVFQLYYERDTISLMGLGEERDGLYEINFLTDPIREQ